MRLFAALAFACAVSAAPALTKEELATLRRDSNATTIGRLRLVMLRWYCATGQGHEAEPPCENFMFMQKLRAAENNAERRAIVKERHDSMPKTTPARNAYYKAVRDGNMRMYERYCELPTPDVPEVCSNAGLKQAHTVWRERSSSSNGVSLRSDMLGMSI